MPDSNRAPRFGPAIRNPADCRGKLGVGDGRDAASSCRDARRHNCHLTRRAVRRVTRRDVAQRVDTLAGPQLRGPDLPDRDRWR